ncbi:protein phosphatase 2C domain-containing protein [Streptomyces sp. NPDC048001]|uniref:protein phosphatase 2C domain-containing protein n=1 Tax=Streptomyces sp. NPDC048001 TaxID=3365498 RepID=UPI003715C65A
MAHMDQSAVRQSCPGCEEPVEPGDRFCGVCGRDLSVLPAPARPAPAGSGAPVEWPAADGADTSGLAPRTQQPGDLPGTDSGGGELPDHRAPAAPAAPASEPPATPPAPAVPPPATPPAPAVPAPAMPPAPSGAAPQPVADAGRGAAQREPGPAPVRHDHPGDFELAAPRPAAPPAVDPRAVHPPVAAPAARGRACVACRSGRVDTDGYCENCGHAQPRERDHIEEELGAVAAVSDRGLRHHRNEDAFAVSSTALPDGSPAVLAVVCDGVSSATRPDEASEAAARAASERLLTSLPRGTHPQQAMHEAIVAAAEAVGSLADTGEAVPEEDHRHRNAPACTIVGAVCAGGLLVVGWVGDSRAYWVPDDRSGPPARLTEDDSWAAQMVAAGLMNEAEAYADERAHAITGWLGADALEVEPHTAAFKPDRPGVVVVCTDGLWNYAEGAQDMARAVPPDAAERPLHSARTLVGHALDGGGHDNVTVAVLPFAVAAEGPGPAGGGE